VPFSVAICSPFRARVGCVCKHQMPLGVGLGRIRRIDWADSPTCCCTRPQPRASDPRSKDEDCLCLCWKRRQHLRLTSTVTLVSLGPDTLESFFRSCALLTHRPPLSFRPRRRNSGQPIDLLHHVRSLASLRSAFVIFPLRQPTSFPASRVFFTVCRSLTLPPPYEVDTAQRRRRSSRKAFGFPFRSFQSGLCLR
jgi:hypothetical protein